MDDEEGYHDVLERQEEVFSVCGEREFVSVGIGEGYPVCKGFENVGG